jgi:hypothetical protein
MQGLEVGDQDNGVAVSFQRRLTASSRACRAPRARALASERFVLSHASGAWRSAVSQIWRNGACAKSSAIASAIEKTCTSQPSCYSHAGTWRFTSRIWCGGNTR